MCGRLTLTRTVADVREHFALPDGDGVPELFPRYNVAPTQPVLTVRAPRVASLLRWGLIPSWASDVSIGNRLLNARAETLDEKPAFKSAFAKRRCLVVVDGFYEWKADGRSRVPFHITIGSPGVFALAGLWDTWHAPDGRAVESFTILTTSANARMAAFHDRMPVIVAPAAYDLWLSDAAKPTDLRALLTAWPDSDIMLTEANPHVNNARHEGPLCLAAPSAHVPGAERHGTGADPDLDLRPGRRPIQRSLFDLA